MSIQKQIVVRYRSRGHVRFDIPDVLCDPAVADLLIADLARIDGVRSADVYTGRGKLAIHYSETVCTFSELATRIFDCVQRLQASKGLEHDAGSIQEGISTLGRQVNQTRPIRWVRKKYTEAKETLGAITVLAKIGVKKPSAYIKGSEKTVVNFFNDVLVLYLIKRFWPVITAQWLPHPIRYRYEWLTVFYLFYLLVRSRMSDKT